MIEALVAALNTRDSRLDWRDLADSLWLAIHTPRSGDEQYTEPVSAPAQPSNAAAATGHSPAVASPSAVDPPVGREPSPTIAWQRNPLELGLDRADTGQSTPPTITPGGLEFAPGYESESLPGELRIARALRPLRHRRRPSRNTTANTALNVDETIEHFCRTRELIPILEPAAERWFREAAVVVDGGPTMIVWREMVAAFTRLLGREGAFERVTQWTLDYESGPPVLRDRGGTGYPTGQLVDYAGRRLIFLFSDCVSELWRDSRAAWDVLELWGRFDPVVLVQTLPWRLWPATALASGEVAVSGQQRGNPNRLLRVRLPWWSMEEHATAIGTPIVTLDESMLGDWAHMLMARGRRSVPGVIAPVLEQSPIASRPTRSDIDPRAIVETFHATASEPATRLATLLSAVEVDLTIARLILRELVPGGRQVHVAEVLASGLLQRPKPNTPESFDFTPGTREILHESISKTTALDVWRTIAPHLERTGRKGAFSIVLDRAARKGQQTTAMARIAGELADRLGIEPWIEAPLAAATVSESESESESRSLMEWTAQQERRRVEFRTRLLTRAMGNYDDKGWWFCGRHTALAAIATWLTHPEPDRSMLVVTGAPGSGKSAVLGLIAALADAEYRTNAVQVLDLPPEVIPAVGAVDVAIYAQNLGVDQVRDGIAAAARVTAATVDELARALAQRTAVLTVLIDALDEATDSHAVAGKLLRPLIDRAGSRLRLLIGTRRTVLEDLGADRDTIDLDSAQHADRTATIDYIERVLRGSSPGTVYADCEPEQVRAIATAIADQADGSFLVAMIVAAALSGTRAIPDPDDPQWRRSLPKLPGEAMAHDLRSRLGDAAARAQHLLLPLAFAEGQGLPDKELWAPLASRIAAVEYNHDDLTWLFRTAGSYVVEAREAGYSAYRLHHQALAEHLAKDLAPDAVHATFVEVLRQRVPTLPDGSRDWSGAHPYILRHLATHAAHAGLVDELVTDMDYLVHAEPTALLAVLSTVVTAPAQLIRAVYRCSATHHRRLPPAGRRQILAVDAARFQARDRQEQLNRTLDWPARWATGNLIDPAHRATLTGHVGAVTSVACMTIDDRPVAVTAGHDRMVRVWDLDAELERAVLTGHTDWVTAAACTVVDGRPVAVTTSFDGTMRVWDLRAGAEIRVFTGHTDAVTSVACTDIGDRPVAATTSFDGTMRVWDLRAGAEIRVFTGHTDAVTSVACTDIGDRPVAVTTGRDRTVRVWDLTTGAEIRVFTGHTDWISGVACMRIGDETIAVTTSYDRSARVWDLMAGVAVAVFTGHTDPVTAVTCAHIGGETVAVTTSYDRKVRVWDPRTGIERAVFTGHTNWVSAVACTSIHGDPIVVTAGWDHSVRVWELDTSRHVRQASVHTDLVFAATIHALPESVVAVTTSRDGTARVWDLGSGAERTVFTGHTDWVTAVACTSVDGDPIAVTTSRDDTVRVWDVRTGMERTVFTGHTHWVTAVACTSIDGDPVAVTTSRDDTVRVWDPGTGIERAVLSGHTNPLCVACTTVDGTPVAVTAGDDRTVLVWDLRFGVLLEKLPGHTGSVNAVACTSIDGVPVAITAGTDRSIRIWDLRSRTLVDALSGHTGAVNAVACTSIDGAPVAITAGTDRSIRIWDLRTMSPDTVIDCPTRQQLVAVSPETEILLALGNDVAVLSRRS